MPTVFKAIGVILLLPFVLAFLLVRAAWRKDAKLGIVTLVLVVGVFGAAAANSDDGDRQATAAVGEAASPQPDPYALVTVPDFHGNGLAEATAAAEELGWKSVAVEDATLDHRSVSPDATGWRVCFQQPSADRRVLPKYQEVTLYAVPEAEECPKYRGGFRRVTMPDLIGEQLDDATRQLSALGLDRVRHFHAHTGKELPDAEQEQADWRICRQEPTPSVTVETFNQVELWLISDGKPCTAPSPEPKPKPKPKPEPKPDYGSTSGGASGGSSTSGGSSGGSSSTSGGSTGGGSTSGGGTSGGRTGVGFGQFCSPVGATATTADGRPAKCFMGRDGQARWGYNSG
ncbi:PASTA domain-containing protein [Streptomyces fragilis]|uniref:PASTA domain-containing protein n=2 Tax=Streptomyces fragilis TaxID=67301 RepID=A0ABV2YDL3_9ACTN